MLAPEGAMAFGKAAGSGPGGLVRPLALAACALALALLSWRGAALLTGPGEPVSASPAEAALADILAPVAGPGLSRLSVTYNAEGGRTVLILLDEAAASRIAELERVAPLAAGLIPERGDRLVIESVAFAPGLPGRPDLAAWLELAALAGLALIGGILAMTAGRGAPAVAAAIAPAATKSPDEITERPRAAVRPLRPVPAPMPTDAAAELARTNPAGAAATLRSWMGTREETP